MSVYWKYLYRDDLEDPAYHIVNPLTGEGYCSNSQKQFKERLWRVFTYTNFKPSSRRVCSCCVAAHQKEKEAITMNSGTKFWMVMLWMDGQVQDRSTAPTLKHFSKKAAQTEMERLAAEYPGKAFYLLEAIAFAKTQNVVTTYL